VRKTRNAGNRNRTDEAQSCSHAHADLAAEARALSARSRIWSERRTTRDSETASACTLRQPRTAATTISESAASGLAGQEVVEPVRTTRFVTGVHWYLPAFSTGPYLQRETTTMSSRSRAANEPQHRDAQISEASTRCKTVE
jgi:hypothetical protein